MKNIKLYIPKVEDLWFRQECMSDPETMSYNAGYNVSNYGYHFDTGCIDFPKESWKIWHNEKMSNPNFYYAYILDTDTNKFVGYLNFNKNPQTQKATMGIVINSQFRGMGYMRPAMEKLFEEAKAREVSVLTDTVPQSRQKALKVFFDLGFEKVGEFAGVKFNKEENIFEIEKILTKTKSMETKKC